MFAAIAFMGEGWPRPGGVRGALSLSGPGEEVFQMLGPRAGRGVYDCDKDGRRGSAALALDGPSPGGAMGVPMGCGVCSAKGNALAFDTM